MRTLVINTCDGKAIVRTNADDVIMPIDVEIE